MNHRAWSILDHIARLFRAAAESEKVHARTLGDAKARELLHQAATVTFAGLHLETRLFV